MIILVVVLSVIFAVLCRFKRKSKQSATDDRTHKTEQLEDNVLYGQSRFPYSLEENVAYGSGSCKEPPTDETYEVII